MCVLNATALGTEVIKNLVLPGVGHFTLVDHQRVTGVVCCLFGHAWPFLIRVRWHCPNVPEIAGR